MGAGKDLLHHVADKLTELYGPRLPGLKQYPEGLRLEMHPSTWRAVYTDPDLWIWGSSAENPEKWAADHTGVPLKISTDLEQCTWRLVIVTEEVLDGGMAIF